MAKRFSSTERFSDIWYMGLHPHYKLIIEYMEGTCDMAGVWEPNLEECEFRLGFKPHNIPIDWEDFFETANRLPAGPQIANESYVQRKKIPHIIVLENGKWWLPRFIPFQYGKAGEPFVLSESAPLHIPICRALKAANAWQKFQEYYPDCVLEKFRSKPPEGLSGQFRRYPTWEEIKEWPQGKALPETELKVFYYHYKSAKWMVGGQPRNPQDLLEKWVAKYERDRILKPTRAEGPKEIKMRIEAVDEKIASLGNDPRNQWLPEGKLHPELKPEIMEQIKKLRELKQLYAQELRERKKE